MSTPVAAGESAGDGGGWLDYGRYYLGNLFLVAGVVGFLLGGRWVWLGASTFGLAVVLDLCALGPDFRARAVAHPRLASIPLYLHALLVPALVASAALRLHRGADDGGALGAGGIAGVVATLAWLGVLPNIPVVHEYIHHRNRYMRLVGLLLSIVIADPARRLAHVRGHHVKLGLADDSDTARRGESIYAFMVRAAIGGSREAFESERQRMARRGRSVWSWQSDVTVSLALTALVIGLIAALAGAAAAVTIAAGFVLSRFLLEAFNYLQHYGLVRAPGTRFERRHTWSHLSPVVRAIAFEITNHAHHHMNPDVPFYALIPDPDAPQMPSALLCFLAALVPPLFVRVVAQPQLRHWDRHFATPAERVLAAEANRAAGWPRWLDASSEPLPLSA